MGPLADLLLLTIGALVIAIALSRLLVRRLGNQTESAMPLAAFRIAYCVVLLGEVLQLLYYEPLIVDPVPFLSPAAFPLSAVLACWVAVVVLLTLGLFTRGVTILNYVLSVIVFSNIQAYNYHHDYVITGLNLLLVFMPVSRRLSLDRLRETLRYSSLKEDHYPPSDVSVLHKYVLLLVGLGLVYFDSVFHKLGSPMWVSGLGVWKPASMPHFAWIDWTPLLNSESFVKLVGYGTLVFEGLFVVLMWFRRLHVPLLVVGLGLHLGIVLVFPIPGFGLGAVALYLLMVPARFWSKIGDLVESRGPSLTFFFDAACPVCLRTRLVLEHLDVQRSVLFVPEDWSVRQGADVAAPVRSCDRAGRVFLGFDTYRQMARRLWIFWPLLPLFYVPGLSHISAWVYNKVATARARKCTAEICSLPMTMRWFDAPLAVVPGASHRLALTGLVGLFLFSQVLAIFQSPVGRQVVSDGQTMPVLHRYTNAFGARFLGAARHGVFMDHHFNDTNVILAVFHKGQDGDDLVFPRMDPSGQASLRNAGRMWVQWVCGVGGRGASVADLEREVRRLTAFYAHREGIDLTNARFELRAKHCEVPMEWEPDFLRAQLGRPWETLAEIRWKEGVCETTLQPEDLVVFRRATAGRGAPR